jgi:hypothetical protein
MSLFRTVSVTQMFQDVILDRVSSRIESALSYRFEVFTVIPVPAQAVATDGAG